MRFAISISIIAISLVGCIQPSGGELGRAGFSWDRGLGCLIGCNAVDPLAVGSTAILRVDNDEQLPPFVATSEDAAILAVHQDSTGDASLTLDGVSVGTARVLLDEPGGAQIDRIAISVRDVDRIVLDSPPIQRRLVVMVGGSTLLQLVLFSGSQRLVGHGGVSYAAAGGLEGSLSVTPVGGGLASIFVGSVAELASVSATAVGTGRIDATTPTGSLAIETETVDETGVASLTTTTDPSSSDPSEAEVQARGYVADGEEIRGLICDWTIAPATGPLSISSTTGSSTRVSASAAGTATVTCTIGTMTSSQTVSLAAP